MSEDTKKRRILRRLRLDRVDGVPAGANPGAFVALHKSDQPRTNETGETIVDMSETSAAVEQADEAVDEAVVETPAAETVGEATPAAVAPELVAASRETVTKAEHEAIVKQLAEMRDREELREFTDIAKSELSALPEKAETMGQLLRKCKRALADGEYQTLFRLLKAANAQTDTSALFAQFGKTEDADALTVDEQITAKAEELRKADPKLSPEQAKAKVMIDSPELRKAYGAHQGN